MSKARLLIVTTSFPAGAGEGFLEEEFSALVEQGVELVVVPLWPRGRLRDIRKLESIGVKFLIRPLFDFEIIVCAARELFLSPKSVTQWILRIIKKSQHGVLLKNIVTIPKALWLARFLRVENIVHVHAHWASATATCVMVAADISKTEWSYTAHRWDIYENNIIALKAKYALFSRFISSKGLNDAVNLGVDRSKSVIVHMGVALPDEINLNHVARRCRPFRVMCAANLIPVKGHQYLLNAIGILSVEGISIELHLAGEGSLRLSLERLVGDLAITAQVKFMGQLGHTQLLESYLQREYDIFVLPSVDLGNGEHEGIPVSLMEAMAYGIPVLSTQTGSIEELLPREIGATVPDKSAVSIANVLRLLATNENYLRNYSERQQAIIKDWSSDVAAKKILQHANVKCNEL
jgi:colanic acid/amylovoran biosynthesis glycosyltransferase